MIQTTLKYLFILLILSSCESTKEVKVDSKVQEEEETEVTNQPAHTISTECPDNEPEGFNTDSSFMCYINYLNTLDCHHPKSIGLAAKELSSHLSKSDTAKADSLFYLFNNYYGLVTDSLNKVLEYDTTDYTAFVIDSEPQRKASLKASKYYEELRKNGFDFIYPEGIIEISQDRDFIKKQFYRYLSKTMISYLEQINNENKNWFQSDAAIIIPEEEFLARVLWWEKFNDLNPKFLFSKASQYNEKFYLYFLIVGMDNTSPFMEMDNTLTGYFKNLYELAYKQPVETDCIKIIKTQYEMIIRNQMKDSEERGEYIKELKKENKIISFDYL